MRCRVCGELFDMTDLTQVAYHEVHRPISVLIGTDGKPIQGKKLEAK